MKFRSVLFVFISLLFLSACATYYQKTLRFQEMVRQGELSKAQKLLAEDKRGPKGKDRFLHFTNMGWINQMMNQYDSSNTYFHKADHYIEDHRKNIASEALALVSNPMVKPYVPEDFETVLVNYYKAINYLNLNDMSGARVECRRINLRLNELNDRYKDHKNRYQEDAFAHIMMGLIYEANGEINNAFIAYRNAYDVYKNSYSENFGIEAPLQLKKDILRTAMIMRFTNEVRFYEKEFGFKYDMPKNAETGEVVVIWHNGLGPVKSEWSINFSKVDAKGGWIHFVNDEYGLKFPIYIGDQSDENKSAFEKMSFLRVAFPKYLERKPLYKTAVIITPENRNIPLELSQDINEIAFKSIRDRMMRELANSILRLATKKALEITARKNDQDEIGTALSIVNALTEKADTRNWQVIPNKIYYARISLPAGNHQLLFKASAGNREYTKKLNVSIEKDRMKFVNFTILDSFPPSENHP